MPDLLIIARESKVMTELRSGLERSGFESSVISFEGKIAELISRRPPGLVLVEASEADSPAWKLIRKLKSENALPVIALMFGDAPDYFTGYSDVDDFITSPYNVRELAARIQRILKKSEKTGTDIIKSDNLVIDLTNCEVTLSGKTVELTFKEYELLKLLAANKGRVYTREDLLNKIWGYEYFGGDRTVDVHVRRLRSKIEGPTDTFIETVRNIGYRFKKG